MSHYKIGELLPRDIDPSADLVDDKGIEGLKKLFDGDPDRVESLICGGICFFFLTPFCFFLFFFLPLPRGMSALPKGSRADC